MRDKNDLYLLAVLTSIIIGGFLYRQSRMQKRVRRLEYLTLLIVFGGFAIWLKTQ